VSGKFEPVVRQRVRIRFSKQDDLRLIGHRDLVRLLERLFRRAGLRLGMSEGFHPKPRMSFPSALAVGIEGLDEVMELELAESYPGEELLGRLVSQTVAGLEFRSVEVLAPGAGKAKVHSAQYQVSIPAGRSDQVAARTARLLACSSCPIDRPKGRGPVDVRRDVQELDFRDGVLTMRLSAGRGPTAGPREVLRALGLDGLEDEGVHIKRTAVELEA
jgi:radical SAM-linked protein